MNDRNSHPSSARLDRRRFLKGASLAGATLALGRIPFASAQSQSPLPRHTLVYVFLRGGADGLSLCAPAKNVTYQQKRPNIAIPDDAQYKLSGEWYLPAAMAPLQTAWNNLDLAFVQGVGLPEKNRSHFVAMDQIERGTSPGANPPNDGWVARHLGHAGFSSEPPLRGLAMQKTAAKSFLQAEKSLAIQDVTNFQYPGGNAMENAMKDMYGALSTGDPTKAAGDNAFAAIDYLDNVPWNAPTGSYPATGFGTQFKRLAALILTGNAPEVVEIDLGSWDHHSAIDPNNPGGAMYDKMDQLANTLAAFYHDLAQPHPGTTTPLRQLTTVVVMSEFGRRAAQNSSLGTDHGWGGVMMALGGKVNGGQVYADPAWSNGLGLDLDTDDDVIASIDYRNVLIEALVDLMKLSPGDVQQIYPGLTPSYLGLFA